MKWNTICSPVEVGGLSIKDIRYFNDALLAKWKWRLGVSNEGLWRDILEARYDNWRYMGDTSVYKKESLWWKDVKKVCGKGLQRNWFDCRLQWRVGDGKCVKFWEDRWVDGLALKENFPRLYSISQNKDSLVGDLVEWEDNRPSRCTTWNLSWRRERLDWEKNLEEQMIAMISNVKWEVRGQDRLVWVEEDLQKYTVKSGYSILNCEDLMQISETF